MTDIEISENGVAKLLSNLNSAKAAGPDATRPIVLRQVVAPIVIAIFQKSLDKGSFRLEASPSLPSLQER